MTNTAISIMERQIKNKINKRQESNRQLVTILMDMVEKYPDLRFGQLLAATRILQYERNTYDEELELKDPFNEESTNMLRRVQRAMK